MPSEITAKTFFGTLASMTALLIGMMVYLIGGVEDRITRMEERLIGRFDGRIDRLEHRINDRFDQVDARFERLEERTGGIEGAVLGLTPSKKKHP